MSPSICALCDVVITEKNDTKEHIIPNAIGGRKKVKGFICNDCNNLSGDEWDSVLAEQLQPLSLLFSIKRERKSVPSKLFTSITGEKLRLNIDGSMDIEKPIVSEEPIEDGTKVKLRINARNEKEARRILKGMQGKYPKLNLARAYQEIETRYTYDSDPLIMDLSFGGSIVSRSIVKTALALAVSSGVPTDKCQRAVNCLKDMNADICFGYYYESDLILNRPDGIPLHCVSIKACSKSKTVLGYVEYFGFRRMVVYLADDYEGIDLIATYGLNPETGEELPLEVNLNFSHTEMMDIFNYKCIPDGAIETVFDKLMPRATKRDFQREMDRAVTRPLNKAVKNCGAEEGGMILPEHSERLTNILLNELRPFIIRHLVTSRNRKA